MYDFQGRIYNEEYGDRLFLRNATFIQYVGNSDKRSKVIFYGFDTNGFLNFSEHDALIRNSKPISSVQTIDVSANWEEYPKFGQYESIIRKERGLEM